MSDIHAMSREIEELKGGYNGTSGGFLRVEDRDTLKNPILAIFPALQNLPTKVDLLLCLGDLTHQAKQLPLMAAWQDIHTLARKLRIEEVFGVIGNHDVSSRANTKAQVDARTEFLQQISPSFPSSDSKLNNEYFAHGVASKEYNDCLLVLLNTCRTHGLGLSEELTKDIFEKGALTSAMCQKAKEAIEASNLEHVVIAMHHHPIRVTENPSESDDEIELGATFLSAVAETGKNILVLHGHKHYVKVREFQTSSKSPVVFSSASLCAHPFESEATQHSNQFHIVDFDTAISDRAAGKILSWDWGATKWEASQREHMPATVFFGADMDANSIAARLASHLPVPFLDRDQLITIAPELKYVDRKQVKAINDTLLVCGRKIVWSQAQVEGMIYEEDQPDE